MIRIWVGVYDVYAGVYDVGVYAGVYDVGVYIVCCSRQAGRWECAAVLLR